MDTTEHRTNNSKAQPDVQETQHHNLFNCADDIQTYKCDGCEYNTQYWVKHIEHRFGTRDDKHFPLDCVSSLVCKICAFQSFSKFIFLKHIYSGCLETASSAYLFLNNDTLCFAGSNFEVREYCDQCSEYFQTLNSIKWHKRGAHCLKEYNWLKCDRCNFQTLRSTCLEAHKTSNSCENFKNADGKWFECNKCLFKTQRKRCLPVHFFRRHGHIYKCDLCTFTTKVSHRVKYHQRREHHIRDYSDWLECDQCSFKAASNTYLKQHILSKHKLLDKSQWLLCDQCGLRTKSNSRLLRHQREKHTADFAGYKCPHCSYKAKQQYHVTLHVTQRHTAPEDMKWFECAHCPYKAKIKASLKNHLLRRHKSFIKNYVV